MFLSSNNTAATPQETNSISQLVSEGWTITADGPSGTQLSGKKRMKTLDALCFGVGAFCLFLFWPLGSFLIVISLIDYFFLTKPESRFIPRA
jgi:hypothetical protein